MLIVRRVEALGKFLDTDDGKNLLAGNKRAANILRIEEKKDSTTYTGAPDPQLYRQDEERALAARDRRRQGGSVAPPSRSEDFAAAMTRDGEAAPARRCVLRQGHGQRRRRRTRRCARTA